MALPPVGRGAVKLSGVGWKGVVEVPLGREGDCSGWCVEDSVAVCWVESGCVEGSADAAVESASCFAAESFSRNPGGAP